MAHALWRPSHRHLLTLLFSGVLALAARDLRAEPALSAAEYALFSALLQHGLDPATKQAIIADTTTGDPARIVNAGAATEDRAKELGTSLELLREWSRMNQRAFALAADFKLAVPYVLFTDADRDLLFRGDQPIAGWNLFFERYPGSSGVIRLSRVAFDAQGAHALVYLEFQCGPECGSGRLVEVSRDPAGAWQVDGGELIWMAGPQS